MPRKTPPLRLSLFDNLHPDPDVNLFCEKDDLQNEASVETFFVNRLLKDLGYRDNQIQTKKSISEFDVPLGRKTVKYKPDYVLTYYNVPKWVLDAKASGESLDKWVQQCSGYCLELNRGFPESNPVSYFMLTNGVLTRVYKWDVGIPLLELSFAHFNIANPKYEQLKAILGASNLQSKVAIESVESHKFSFHKPTAEEAKRIFAQCHKVIWKSEGYSPTAAFMEFVKLMFVKLWADRELREDDSIRTLLEQEGTVKLPRASITFSSHWIDSSRAESPVNDVLFKRLRDTIERDIAFRKKKRIFDKDEKIDMQPDTIKSVARRLEHYDMFGIDEDLNGRLFETFLSATMRGRELGQYFTPRSIVKLMVRMANLRATPTHMDKVIDACCGTGGFLIEALGEMRNEIRANKSLTNGQRHRLFSQLANESIYGIDFGRSPPIARIARINMYLHGDGGSRIYYADSLDKELQPLTDQEPETLKNQDELKRALEQRLLFNVALTNPPFSMTKELSNDTEARILKQYDLARIPGTSRYRSSLRSSAMFIERHGDLLEPGGRLFTVIDDTLLASDNFSYVRDFIRDSFIIRAIVSLPGDAFRRSGSRVKTSVLCLEKKVTPDEQQSDVFYAFAEHIGVDDLPSKASSYDVAEARKKAETEIERISSAFLSFLDGDTSVSSISPNPVKDRLDLKHVVPLQGRFVSKWESMGIDVVPLGGVAIVIEDEICPQNYPNQEFALIRVSYAGVCQVSKRQKGKHIKPTKMYKVSKGDLVFSNIRATDGAVGIVPDELDGALASGSYTMLRCPTAVDTVYLWSILRSHEIRADLMSVSTGTSRYTTLWESARQVKIPWMDMNDRKRIAESFMEAWKLEKEITKLQSKAYASIAELGVESDESKQRFNVYKPPK